MIPGQGSYAFIFVRPAGLVDNASFTTQTLNRGSLATSYDTMNVYFMLGANDIAMTALKLQHSQNNSDWYDISGSDFTATLPSATDDNKIWKWEVNLHTKYQYIKVIATNGDGSAGGYATCIGILERAGQTPNTATEKGCAAVLNC